MHLRKSMKTKFINLFLIPFAITLTGCSKEDVSNTIFTSIYPVYDFVNRIVGDKYKVVNLTPAGMEPHDFELSAKQITRLVDAKAIFISGVTMEHWYDSLPTKAKEKTYVVSKDIEIQYVDGQIDPHVWLSPIKAIKELENIVSYLNTIDPTNSGYYQENYLKAKAEFTLLDTIYKQEVTTFSNKNVVVAHAAYGYLFNEYGLNQISVNGVEPDKEPSSKTIEDIINKVKEYNITTIFTEELISDKIAKQIAKECGVKVDVLNPFETIDGDENYISVMEDNLMRLGRACK